MDEHSIHGPAQHGPTPGAGPEAGDYDALAELFLGSGRFAPEGLKPRHAESVETFEPRGRVSEGGPAARLTPVAPAFGGVVELEAVVLGHLPVRAGLWAREYAASVAKRLGAPVGLVRCAGGSVGIELIGLTGLTGRGPEASDDLLEAIESARPLVARWIVRVDETDEPEVTTHPALDRVAVLSGADEAAVVASYRLIKSLAVEWQSGLDDGVGPAIGVGVMGAADEAADDAEAKIARAAETFLDRPLERLPRASKIGSTPSAVVFHGPADRSVREVLDLVSVCGPEPAASEALAGGHTLRLTSDAPSRAYEGEAAEAHEPTIVVKAGVRNDAAIERGAGTVSLVDEDEASELVSACRPLSGVIGGLTRLESRCPRAPGVELAADLAGGLHLIAEGAASLAELEAARSWAREHLPLLLRAETRLAMPTSDRDASDGPAVHVVVTEAGEARGLLDTDVRAHVLRRVRTPVGDGYVAIELN